jgi:putative ABC transport system permease protein
MNSLIKEISYTIRGLARRPALTAIAVVTLALGIGLVTIQFSFVNAVMIKGLPFERSERIMKVERIDEKGNTRSISLTDFSAWRERQKSFGEFAALDSRETLRIGGDGLDARSYRAAAFSAGVLNLLGVQPLLGRGFSAEDERVGAAPVVLLSYPVWKESFGGDPNIAGRTIRLSGKPATILGVMPEGFAFPTNHQAWINLRPVSAGSPEGPGVRARADFIGRLNNDTTLAGARAEFALLNAQSESTSANSTQPLRVKIVPYIDSMRESELNIVLLSMLVVVGGVLAMACLNVANLLSARALQRGHELAIRSDKC